ncbi:MAG: 30S ribosomal protein S8 [Brevinematia bacterium]
MGIIAYTVGDALNRIKNAGNAGHPYVYVKKSKFLSRILDIMKSEGYIDSYEDGEKEFKYFYKVNLKYYKGKPVIKEIKILSYPSRRLYIGYRDIKLYKNNMGIVIISTPRGVMTTAEAKKLGIGGMLICAIW